MSDERKVLTITTFERHGGIVENPPEPELDDEGHVIEADDLDPDDDGPELWHWHTQTANGEIVGDGAEGYNRLSGAVHGFWAQQGVNPDDAQLSSDYSQLERVNANVYQIKKFESQQNSGE